MRWAPKDQTASLPFTPYTLKQLLRLQRQDWMSETIQQAEERRTRKVTTWVLHGNLALQSSPPPSTPFDSGHKPLLDCNVCFFHWCQNPELTGWQGFPAQMQLCIHAGDKVTPIKKNNNERQEKQISTARTVSKIHPAFLRGTFSL